MCDGAFGSRMFYLLRESWHEKKRETVVVVVLSIVHVFIYALFQSIDDGRGGFSATRAFVDLL